MFASIAAYIMIEQARLATLNRQVAARPSPTDYAVVHDGTSGGARMLVGPGGVMASAHDETVRVPAPSDRMQHDDPEEYSRRMALHRTDVERAAEAAAANLAIAGEWSAQFRQGLSEGRCSRPADFNCDGVIDSRDYFDFLTAFFEEGGNTSFSERSISPEGE